MSKPKLEVELDCPLTGVHLKIQVRGRTQQDRNERPNGRVYVFPKGESIPTKEEGAELVFRRVLWCLDQSKGHDKVWMARLYRRDDGYVYDRRYGRRGTVLASTQKIVSAAEGAALVHTITNLAAEKIAQKGYREVTVQELGLEDE